MYPNLYYLFKDLFSIDLPALKVINTFGLILILAFLPTGWLWYREYRRKESLGQLKPRDIVIVVGAPARIERLLLHFLLGLLAGYKVGGSLVAGLIIGGGWAFYTWRQAERDRLPAPEKHVIQQWPHQLVLGHVVVAVIAGIVGAKLFGALEDWKGLLADPKEAFSFRGGFAWYGGLVTAILVLWFSLHAWKDQRIHMCDGVAPCLMLGYALGRIACQLSGDGDWGVINLHPKPFGWLPDWLWAYDYPHNVISSGVPLPGCDWESYCYHLSPPVYPTPVYETILCLILFGILLLLRNKFRVAGRLAAVYLIFTGLERLLIGQIRVNTTQANIISIFLLTAGGLWYILAPRLPVNREL
ncbi:MAG TPA: prolipoprotein diacylglyceryl transferase family protein [Puia sp.]|nr:prolipoprotein diacylglyceryl transferase family protein [Puia sp.]